ncbi:uncharacterized protein LOC144436997 [Glandiceps talaboti]
MKSLLISLILLVVSDTIQGLLSVETPSRLVQQLGSTVQINCVLSNDGSSLSVTNPVQDLVWYFKDVKLPDNMYTAINDTTSQLTLDNVTLDEAGNYSCLLEGPQMETVAMASTILNIGTLPGIANFSCVCYNMADMWCTWDEVNSYLPTQFAFTFRLQWELEDWKACPNSIAKGPNSCFIGFKDNEGSLHKMRVTASNALGETEEELWFNPDEDTIPHPPENLQVISDSLSPHSVEVSWERPIDWIYERFFFLQYKLQYCSELDPDNWSEILVEEEILTNRLSYEITDGKPYTYYTIRVAAAGRLPYLTCSHGKCWSQWAQVVGRTRESAPDSGVRELSIDEKNTNSNSRDVTIYWQLPSLRERNGIILGANVTVQEEDGTNQDSASSLHVPIQDTNSTMYTTIPGLDRYKSYKVTITAYNSAGNAPSSSITIPDQSTVPGEPQNLSAKTISENSIAVFWEAPTNPRGTIVGYKLVYQRSTDDREGNEDRPVKIINDGDIHQTTITGLQSFVQYEFKVKAKNRIGYSGFSPTVTQYTQEGVPTGSPTNLTIQPSLHDPTSLEASWKAPCLDDRNGVIRMYTVQFCQYQEVHSNDDDDNSTVISICREGNSRMENFTVIDPNSLEASRAEQHYVMRGLKANTQYAVSVSAFTSQGQGPTTDFVLGKTSMGAPEKIPENVKVQSSSLSDSTMTVEWSPLVGVNHDMVHYEMEVKTMNNSEHCGGIQVLRTNNTEMTIQDLCGYEMYGVVVRACTNADIEVQCGTYSQPVFATTHIGAPSPPLDVEVKPTGDSTIEVTWSPPQRPNGPAYGLNYSIECFGEGNTTMSNKMVTSQTNVQIRVSCNGDINSEDVQATCRVRAINMVNGEEKRGNTVTTREVQICYKDAEWQYIFVTIGIIIFVIFMVCVVYRLYKFVKARGAFDKVSFVKPIWEVKTQDGRNTNSHPVFLYDIPEVYDQVISLPNQEQTMGIAISPSDHGSVHSSDHGVDIDGGQHMSGVSSDSSDNSSIGGSVHAESPPHQIGVLRPGASAAFNAGGHGNIVNQDLDDYLRVSELDGRVQNRPNMFVRQDDGVHQSLDDYLRVSEIDRVQVQQQNRPNMAIRQDNGVNQGRDLDDYLRVSELDGVAHNQVPNRPSMPTRQDNGMNQDLDDYTRVSELDGVAHNQVPNRPSMPTRQDNGMNQYLDDYSRVSEVDGTHTQEQNRRSMSGGQDNGMNQDMDDYTRVSEVDGTHNQVPNRPGMPTRQDNGMNQDMDDYTRVSEVDGVAHNQVPNRLSISGGQDDGMNQYLDDYSRVSEVDGTHNQEQNRPNMASRQDDGMNQYLDDYSRVSEVDGTHTQEQNRPSMSGGQDDGVNQDLDDYSRVSELDGVPHNQVPNRPSMPTRQDNGMDQDLDDYSRVSEVDGTHNQEQNRPNMASRQDDGMNQYLDDYSRVSEVDGTHNQEQNRPSMSGGQDDGVNQDLDDYLRVSVLDDAHNQEQSRSYAPASQDDRVNQNFTDYLPISEVDGVQNQEARSPTIPAGQRDGTDPSCGGYLPISELEGAQNQGGIQKPGLRRPTIPAGQRDETDPSCGGYLPISELEGAQNPRPSTQRTSAQNNDYVALSEINGCVGLCHKSLEDGKVEKTMEKKKANQHKDYGMLGNPGNPTSELRNMEVYQADLTQSSPRTRPRECVNEEYVANVNMDSKSTPTTTDSDSSDVSTCEDLENTVPLLSGIPGQHRPASLDVIPQGGRVRADSSQSTQSEESGLGDEDPSAIELQPLMVHSPEPNNDSYVPYDQMRST